jgi:hypothetical protein
VHLQAFGHSDVKLVAHEPERPKELKVCPVGWKEALEARQIQVLAMFPYQKAHLKQPPEQIAPVRSMRLQMHDEVNQHGVGLEDAEMAHLEEPRLDVVNQV